MNFRKEDVKIEKFQPSGAGPASMAYTIACETVSIRLTHEPTGTIEIIEDQTYNTSASRLIRIAMKRLEDRLIQGKNYEG